MRRRASRSPPPTRSRTNPRAEDRALPAKADSPAPEPYSGIRAVFLDAGLTLVHSDVSLSARISRIAAEHGIAVEEEAVRGVLPGLGAIMAEGYRKDPDLWASDAKVRAYWRVIYVTVFEQLGASGELAACADALYHEYNTPGTWELYPDVLPTLKALHGRGYIIGVISDWGTSLTANILLPLGVGRYIDFMVVSANVREAKPGAGIYREALARAGVEAHQAIHVGDSYFHDVLGARSAGIEGILIDREGRHATRLDCPRIRSLTELPDLIIHRGSAEDQYSTQRRRDAESNSVEG